MELVYEEGTGRLLGGAVVARGHGALRIDVLAALLHREGSVEDLLALDLAYAPPFSPVWDPSSSPPSRPAKRPVGPNRGGGAYPV